MKSIIIAIIIGAIIIGGTILFSSFSRNSQNSPDNNIDNQVQNVVLENGKQIINVKAKGGYFPKITSAQAGVPTVLRINTDNTFDCSSFVRIPSLGVSKALPRSGATDFDLSSPAPGILAVTCGMGMYSFQVNFQ